MSTLIYSFKKRTLAVTIASIFFATTAAGYVMAGPITSSPTVAVTGHKPTLGVGEIQFTDTNSNGKLDVGETLGITTDGAFEDIDGDDKGQETYQWMAGASVVGTERDYTVQVSDMGQVITLKVTPHTDPSITEPADGDAVIYGGRFPVVKDGELLAVEISGVPIVNSTLTAETTCIVTGGGEGACSASSLNYQWQIESSPNSGTFTDISGATETTYVVLKGDQKRKVQVVVEEKGNAN